MLVIQDALDSGDLPQEVVATIGNYDGIHRGQRAILDRVVERARALELPAVMVTFEPHPFAVLRPEARPPRLTTPAQKERLVAEAGIDVMLVLTFDRNLANTPADRFIRQFLHKELQVRELYVGPGFSFGKSREGTLELLAKVGSQLGFAAEAAPEVVHGGERISSTRIRQVLHEGRVEDAAEMLGRPYGITGSIARGDRMGQRLGWPTINLAPDNELVPADGVYSGRARFEHLTTTFSCATNIGTRPTVYENFRRVVESHVLDFSGDVYGQRVEIEFHKRLREERVFSSVMDLSAQIRLDVEATREYFSSRRRS